MMLLDSGSYSMFVKTCLKLTLLWYAVLQIVADGHSHASHSQTNSTVNRKLESLFEKYFSDVSDWKANWWRGESVVLCNTTTTFLQPLNWPTKMAEGCAFESGQQYVTVAAEVVPAVSPHRWHKLEYWKEHFLCITKSLPHDKHVCNLETLFSL